MRLSDGAVVPGNARIGADEIARRIAAYHRPYHDRIASTLDAMQARGLVPVIVSVHTYTPVWRGLPRPWHAGILWDTDDRLARPLIAALAEDATLVVGDNEPYDGALRGDTMWQHGTVRGLPHAIVEIRQDLVAGDEGADDWAARLAAILTRLAPLPDLGRRAWLGSRTDKPGTRPMTGDKPMDEKTRIELEAAVFRRLVDHLRKRTDVQNIDMMNLAGFCRNCLSNWMKDAADAAGVPMSKDETRVAVYGMPYDEWKAKYQAEASAEQKAAFTEVMKHPH
jgi:hypothetical protein